MALPFFLLYHALSLAKVTALDNLFLGGCVVPRLRLRNTQITKGLDQLCPLGCTASLHHFVIHIIQVLLLRSEYGSRTSYSYPANEVCWWESNMLHNIESNQRASSSQACFAVNCQRTFFILRMV